MKVAYLRSHESGSSSNSSVSLLIRLSSDRRRSHRRISSPSSPASPPPSTPRPAPAPPRPASHPRGLAPCGRTEEAARPGPCSSPLAPRTPPASIHSSFTHTRTPSPVRFVNHAPGWQTRGVPARLQRLIEKHLLPWALADPAPDDAPPAAVRPARPQPPTPSIVKRRAAPPLLVCKAPTRGAAGPRARGGAAARGTATPRPRDSPGAPRASAEPPPRGAPPASSPARTWSHYYCACLPALGAITTAPTRPWSHYHCVYPLPALGAISCAPPARTRRTERGARGGRVRRG